MLIGSSSASTWSSLQSRRFIAAQALITGMFSIVKQAIALGFCPRFEVKFTSREAEGQVYIPAVNWTMFLGCVMITLAFRTSGNLAAAYGIAVTGTMGITTLAFGYVAYYRWGWRIWKVLAVCTPIMARRPALLRQQSAQVHARGLLPRGDRRRTRLDHAHLAVGSGRARQGVLCLRRSRGKKISWLVALREKVDEIQLSIDENLPRPRTLVQGRRRLVETDRASSSSVHARSATLTSMCRSRCASSSRNSAYCPPT